MRKCERCGVKKELDEFRIKPSCKEGRTPKCKQCYAELYQDKRDVLLERRRKQAEEIQNDPDKQEAYRANQREYYAANKDAIRAKRAQRTRSPDRKAAEKDTKRRRYQENKALVAEQQKRYYEQNREIIKERRKEARKNGAYREFEREYCRKRRAVDVNFRLLGNIRTRINLAVKNKSESTRDLIGCDVQTYKDHLAAQFTPEMSWDNYGTFWSVDHIKPCCSFDLEDPEQQRQCFHYSNCQPLEIPENSRKGQTSDRVLRDARNKSVRGTG